MTRDKAIAELVRIWHSPHLDLSLKAGLAEVIETLKEKNQSDSLVTDSSDACKENKSKLDLISRADAIEVLTETIAPPSVTLDTLVMRIDALPSAEAVQGWIPCSERLPDDNREVLISLEWGIDIGTYERGEWRSEWINHYDDDNVLAWMPLPTPYKGGDDE